MAEKKVNHKEDRSLLKKKVPTASEKDVVEKSMGTFGRWHLWICLAIFLVKFPVAWHQLNIVIESPPVDFHCSVNATDKCSTDCPEHIFDKSIFTNTIITQWDLVCEQSQLANLAQLITMLGILFGNMVFSIFSDKYGRRLPLVIAVLIQLVFGCVSAFIPIFWLYLIARFITAFATGGTMITSFVLTMEIIGVKWRTTVGILYQIPFNLGHLLLALIGFLVRDWRHMQLCVSVPSILLISYYWIMPESPRWLLAVDKPEEAITTLEKIARYNRLPTEQIKTDIMEHVSTKYKTKNTGGNVLDLFKTPNIRKNWFCISFNWIVCGLCFFGVAQFMGQIGGDIFMNIAFSAIVQIPGTFFSIWSMKALGRRKTLMLANAIAGVSCIVIAFLPADSTWVKTVFGSTGMFGLSVAFPTVYIYSGELFPTVIRNIGVGSSSMCARVGSMVAPFVAGLSATETFIAPMIFGITPLLGAFLCFMLPETLDCKLPDTIEEAEEFGKKKKAVEVEMQHSGS